MWVWNGLWPKLQQLSLNKGILKKCYELKLLSLDYEPICTPKKAQIVQKLIIVLDSLKAIFDFGHLQGANWGQS